MEKLSIWKFFKADVPVDSSTESWATVSVPHTWNAEDGHNDGSYYRGPGWYQTYLKIDELKPGERAFLRFAGVATVAEVYLDQKCVGTHLGGYSAFIVEITDHVKTGVSYDLRVRAENTPRSDVAPLSGDFTKVGGIHRPVELIIKNSVCISPMDHASPGVFIFQEKVSEAQADLRVRVLLDNGDRKMKKIKTRLTLTDAGGKTVASKALDTRIKPGHTERAEQVLNISTPNLWQGIKDPYLYTLKVELFDGIKIVDSYAKRVGFRFYHVDPQLGFFLNGKSYRLRGVAFHQDRAGNGAVSDENIREDFERVCEIGANAVRLAHYPHSGLSYERCDELGILTWAEIPLVDRITHDPGFAPNARQQLLEMIRQHGNHCSIFTWGISNEIFQKKTDEPIALLTELNQLCKQEDPTRPTTLATNHNRTDLCNITDLFAFNIYPGWYDTNAHGMKDTLMRYNDTGNRRGVGVAEYGAGGSIFHQDQSLEYVVPSGKWHPEQWQAHLHEIHYKDIIAAPECWGSFVWAMFDFSSHDRDEGAQAGVNDKGLMTHDHKTKKDVFYFYKANWSEEPVLHLTSKRHLIRNVPETSIKVYSNCPKVALSVNGKALRTIEPDALKTALWENVKLAEGENKIEITASKNGTVLRDQIIWTYDPAAQPSKIAHTRERVIIEGLFRASDAQSPNRPKNAFDGDTQTRWASSAKDAWLAQELKQPGIVKGISIRWYKGAERSYHFKVETSMDGNTWRPAYSGTSKKTADFETYTFDQPDELRHIRITRSGLDHNKCFSIIDTRLELYKPQKNANGSEL